MRRGVVLAGPLAAAFASLLLAGCVSNSEGYEEGVDRAAVRQIMSGLGAVDPQAKPIDYKPRAPLAMPAKLDDLPPPEDDKQSQVAANWPQNDDKELKELRAIYAGGDPNTSLLTPEQMRGIRIGDGSRPDPVRDARDAEIREGARLTPAEMKAQHEGATKVDTSRLFDPEGRPVRRFLIEPPVAYSTPAANAPLVAPSDDKQLKERVAREMEGGKLRPGCVPSATDDCIMD